MYESQQCVALSQFFNKSYHTLLSCHWNSFTNLISCSFDISSALILSSVPSSVRHLVRQHESLLWSPQSTQPTYRPTYQHGTHCNTSHNTNTTHISSHLGHCTTQHGDPNIPMYQHRHRTTQHRDPNRYNPHIVQPTRRTWCRATNTTKTANIYSNKDSTKDLRNAKWQSHAPSTVSTFNRAAMKWTRAAITLRWSVNKVISKLRNCCSRCPDKNPWW